MSPQWYIDTAFSCRDADDGNAEKFTNFELGAWDALDYSRYHSFMKRYRNTNTDSMFMIDDSQNPSVPAFLISRAFGAFWIPWHRILPNILHQKFCKLAFRSCLLATTLLSLSRFFVGKRAWLEISGAELRSCSEGLLPKSADPRGLRSMITTCKQSGH
jgi:hypothetical protein